MIDILKARIQQGKCTIPFPADESTLAQRFRGLPDINQDQCDLGCTDCITCCPTEAISKQKSLSSERAHLQIDLGKCLFCGECQNACAKNVIHFTQNYRLAVNRREELLYRGETLQLAHSLKKEIRRLFGRSLKLRQVSAGGCNGCEVDINVLSTTVYDLGRFGIQIVASPRHADGLIITGPVTENMRAALLKTFAAVAAPRIIIAVGTCAISGGLFAGNSTVHDGIGDLLPVDLCIPGCPPHPYTILDGLLRLLAKIGE